MNLFLYSQGGLFIKSRGLYWQFSEIVGRGPICDKNKLFMVIFINIQGWRLRFVKYLGFGLENSRYNQTAPFVIRAEHHQDPRSGAPIFVQPLIFVSDSVNGYDLIC